MEYVSDEQQVEQLKKWWSENGNSIIIGIVLGISAILGWRFWGEYQVEQSAQASKHFDAMLLALDNKQYEKAQTSADTILNDYSGTPYSLYAQLSLAKIQFEQKEFAQAEQTYQAVIDANSDESVSFIARKRLADVYIDQEKFDQALSLLSVEYPTSFTASYEERKGDIYRFQGKTKEASSAYLLAKFANDPAEDPTYLQQKMDDLGQ